MNGESAPATHYNSSRVLEQARRSNRGYDSHATREALTKVVRAAFDLNSPRRFQLDVEEALMRPNIQVVLRFPD